jgi:hypothetical protein
MKLETVDLAAYRHAMKVVLVTALVATATLLAVAVGLRSIGEFRALLLLTTIGLAAGAVLGYVELGAARFFPRAAKVALGLLISSQIFYYLLVWTGWRKDPLLWRLWWIAMALATTSAHLLALKLPWDGFRNWVDRWTPWAAALSGAWTVSLACQPDFPPRLGTAYLLVFLPPAALSVGGSIAIWRRRNRKDGAPKPMAAWARAAWVIAGITGSFWAGFYIGGGTRSTSPYDMLPSALAGLPVEQVDQAVRADLERLKKVVTGLDDLETKVVALRVELATKRKDEGRNYYRPEEEDRIRWAFVTYLSYRAALIRLVATYAGFESVRDPDVQARCFTVGYAAAATAFERALQLVTLYAEDGPARKKLNEAEPLWGLQAGMFDRIFESVTDDRNLRKYQEMTGFYELRKMEWSIGTVWPAADFQWLDGRIRRGQDYVETHPVSKSKAWLKGLVKRLKEDTYKPVYTAQTVLSSWIGDTRIAQDEPLISLAKLREVAPLLRPGDLILERRNWFLSNAFLPGFWPHGALYVGTPEELKRLGIADHAELRSRWAEFTAPGEGGHPKRILESISEGVVFNTLEHSLHADYVAVLRPQLKDEDIGKAIVRAFSHQGKPYDFEFDFFTSDKLVCTELLYRSYEGLLKFDLVRVMGRDTLPAIEIVKMFDRERRKPEPKLKFVFFLDGLPAERDARLATEDDLVQSLERDKAFQK